jgi:hypothetical protein
LTLSVITLLSVLLLAVPGSIARADAPQDGLSAPTALSMSLSKTNHVIQSASWISDTTADFRFQVQTSAGDVTPQVEIEPSNVPFTGQPNFSGNVLRQSGVAVVTVTGLANAQTYKWQGRISNASGVTSQWAPFSTSQTKFDLGIDRDPPSRPVITSPSNPTQSRWYNTRVETLQWHANDALSGIQGYSWVISRALHATPPGSVTAGTSVRINNLSDGVWFLALRAQDKAGNWSAAAGYRLQLDRQPARFVWLSPSRISFNPFRGPSVFKFRVTKDAGVTLGLYRVGATRAVASFHYSRLRAGQVATITWSGKDAKGKPFPRGYYFFSANARDHALNFTRVNLGGIALTPEQPHTSATGQILYPDDGKRIIVSLSREALFAYDGTKLVLQTLVTTGNPNLPTPTGHFTVLGKYHPYEFVSPWPEGSPYYYAPSWSQRAMLFKEGGYFLHDAPWRGAFGPGTNGAGQPGTNYGGTHGCVNIPSAPMEFLFGWASVGTTVDVVP